MRPNLLFAVAALASLNLASAPADDIANKQTAARVLTEKLGQGDFSKLDEIYGPDFVAHNGGQSFSLEQDNASTAALRKAVPDMKVTVERVVSEEDIVAVYWSASGTNTSAAAGMPGLGKRGSVQGMVFFRFANGKIVEEWSVTDMLMLMRQLDMMP